MSEQVTEERAYGGAFYQAPQPGDSPYDHGESMESVLRQMQALQTLMGQVANNVRTYCYNAQAIFNAPPVVSPMPASAIVQHVNNLANGPAVATMPTAPVFAPIPTAPTVASNYSVQVDHTRQVVLVSVDVSGSIKASDGKDRAGNAKYHLSKRKTGRTVAIPNSSLAFTIAVGQHAVLHTDARTYADVNRGQHMAPRDPADNVGLSRQGDTLTLYASYDPRVVNVENGKGSTCYARSVALANPKRRTVYLEDGLWYTFRLFSV